MAFMELCTRTLTARHNWGGKVVSELTSATQCQCLRDGAIRRDVARCGTGRIPFRFLFGDPGVSLVG